MSRQDVHELNPGLPAWCQDCDGISGSNFFLWTDDDHCRWICPRCWKKTWHKCRPPDPIILLGPFEQAIEYSRRQLLAILSIPSFRLVR